jgi:hypothetical protein
MGELATVDLRRFALIFGWDAAGSINWLLNGNRFSDRRALPERWVKAVRS